MNRHFRYQKADFKSAASAYSATPAPGYIFMEAAIGVEPMNSGFADRPLSHLGTPPHFKFSHNCMDAYLYCQENSTNHLFIERRKVFHGNFRPGHRVRSPFILPCPRTLEFGILYVRISFFTSQTILSSCLLVIFFLSRLPTIQIPIPC